MQRTLCLFLLSIASRITAKKRDIPQMNNVLGGYDLQNIIYAPYTMY